MVNTVLSLVLAASLAFPSLAAVFLPVPPDHAGKFVVRLPDGRYEIMYEPQAHQMLFHQATQRNVIMEGGAGSGKSLAMRMDAYMRAMATPGFKALILRRSFPELELSHLQHVAFEVKRMGLPEKAWHRTEYTVRFSHPPIDGKPQPDSLVVFGHVESDEHLSKYLSSEWEAIYFDELCTFTLKQFTFLASRARTTLPGIRSIVRGGTNPIGPGASWVRRFFIKKKPKVDEAPDYNPEDYLALKSTVRDNKYVDQTEYRKRLNALPSEALRKAMDHGEWTIEGQYFTEWMANRPDERTGEMRPWHVIDTLPTVKGKPITEVEWIEIVRVVDWGYAKDGNPGVCLWFACLPDHTAICFHEYYFKETLPKDVAKEIIRQSKGLKIAYTVGDPQMWKEHVGPSIAEHFANARLSMVEADNQRVPGWMTTHNWLRETVDDGSGPRPRLQFYVDGEKGAPQTASSMEEMVVDKNNPLDLETTGVADDGPDCVRYFVQSRPGKSKEPKATIPPALQEIYRYCARKRARGKVQTFRRTGRRS